MAVDKSKLSFYSNTEIDQILETGTVPINAGITAIYTLKDVTQPPVFEVVLLYGGYVYQCGRSDHGGRITFNAFIEGGTLFAQSSVAGSARFYVWADRVNY